MCGSVRDLALTRSGCKRIVEFARGLSFFFWWGGVPPPPPSRFFQEIKNLHLTNVHVEIAGLGGGDLVLSTDSGSIQISWSPIPEGIKW